MALNESVKTLLSGAGIAGGVMMTAKPAAMQGSSTRSDVLFNARILVTRAANGYVLTISDAALEGTSYVARDLSEVLQLLQAAMAAVRLEDK